MANVSALAQRLNGEDTGSWSTADNREQSGYPSVVIAIASEGECSTLTAMSIARTMRDYPGLIDIYHAKGTVLPDLRHEIVANGWTQKTDWILWVDKELGFPPFALEWMMNKNERVIGANVTRKTLPPVPASFVETDDEAGPLYTEVDSEGKQKVKHLSLHLMLTHMSVFEELAEDPPIFCFQPYGAGLKTMSDDVYFCQQCAKHGIDVFVDHDVSKYCANIGRYGFSMRDALMGRNMKKQMADSDFDFSYSKEDIAPVVPEPNGEDRDPGLTPYA